MIYSLGEMLIDLMQEGAHYVAYPGGAPANVAAHARKMGEDACFVGKISRDHFGSQLHQTLLEYNIWTPLEKSDCPTALAVVSHDNGERAFQFYRNHTADLQLSIADIDTLTLTQHDILHFCSLGLVPEDTTYAAHRHAIDRAHTAQALLSFDVNLRAGLWKDLHEAHRIVHEILPLVDVIKVNEEELYWLTNEKDIEVGMRQLQTKKQLILCTVGALGSYALTSDGMLHHCEAHKATQVDTTGAGDSFIASVLASYHKSPLAFNVWQKTQLLDALDKASAISAQVVSHKGAIPDINY